VVESGPTDEVFARLAHPYSRGLFAARPSLDAPRGQRLATIPGRVPDLADLPRGCPFADRCTEVVQACHPDLPDPREVGPRHAVRCVHAGAGPAARGSSQEGTA
jgi:peptide/nickel transport system ATP-binding protein